MTDGAVRVALVGLGWAGRSIWLPRLRAHPGFTVAVAVDPDPRARQALPPEASIAAVSGVEELDPAAVDLAVVAVPNHLHAPTALRLLRAGIDTFVEKPVCLTSQQARELAAAEAAGPAMLLAGSAARLRADVAALGRAAGQLGRVRHVSAAWIRARGIPGGNGWFTDRRRAGGGALVDLGWHLLDVILPLLGEPEFGQVVGTASADFMAAGTAAAAWRLDAPAPGGDRGGDVEDTAHGFLVTTTGVSVHLRAAWASHEPYDSTRIRVEGSAGVAELRCTFGFSPNRVGGSALTVTRQGRTSTQPVPAEPIGAEYHRQLDDIARTRADRTAKGRAAAEAARAIELIERFYESADRWRPAAAPVPVPTG
ncbi:Gfo/Idh/MocA family protein [Dactylosporangium sp. CA-092794]|uniref:Gfo/Idh/MocA family protein n=1 Tax=Dactylosporangium sp. CA-092794 TaxID=3239929 RepID=UPI003D9129C7